MPMTEAEWTARQQRVKAERERDGQVTLGLIKQAAVDAQFLTGREEWDKYLRMLQAERNTTQQEVAGVHAQLTTPLSSDALRLLYVKLNVLTERLKILDWCMGLPKQLCEDAAQVSA